MHVLPPWGLSAYRVAMTGFDSGSRSERFDRVTREVWVYLLGSASRMLGNAAGGSVLRRVSATRVAGLP
jgi:hypothetical protein